MYYLTTLRAMPPHCDTLDGPLVLAAIRALEDNNVNIILPWAPKEAEEEITNAFNLSTKIRNNDNITKKVADRWFFETVVRLHREGEGAHFTGLKPEGLDTGPVIPLTEECYELKDTKKVIEYLQQTVQLDIEKRFNRVIDTSNYDVNDVTAGREHINALLDYMTHSHKLYKSMIDV